MNKKVRLTILSLVFIITFSAVSNIKVLAETNNSNSNNMQSLLNDLNNSSNNMQTNAELNEKIGLAYRAQDDIDNSIKYLGLAEKDYEEMGNLDGANNVLEQILSMTIKEKRYTQIIQYSLSFIENSNELYKKTGLVSYLKNTVGIYYLVATICNMMGDYVYGKEYFEIGESLENKYGIDKTSELYYVKSNYYYYQNIYDESEKYAYKGIMLAKTNKDKESYLNGLIYLSRAQLTKNNLKDAKVNLNIVKENKAYVKSSLIESEYYYYYAQLQEKEEEWNCAINDYLNCYSYTSSRKFYEINTNILSSIGNCYSKLGNYEKATEYYQMYIKQETLIENYKQKINTNIIINNHNNDPQNILSEIKIKKSQYNNKILIILIIVALIFLAIIIFAYYNKRKKFEKLDKELKKDVLTTAYNRKYIMQYIGELVLEYEDFSIIMLDVDDYKLVNDTYGHQFGDIVLKKIVETINLVSSNKVKVSRYGGEEFLLVVKGEDLEPAVKVANLIRLAIESIEWKYGNSITASIGVAKCNKFETVKETLKRADELLYEAKRNGKNRVEY